MAWWGGRSTWPTPPERTRSWPDAISSASWSCACRRIINNNRGASASLQEARNMNIVRLYTGKDGQTHIEELDPTTHPELTTLQPTKGIVFRTTKPGHFSDWHNAPRRQFVITLAGEVEIGLGDGTGRRYRPGQGTPGGGMTGRGDTTPGVRREARRSVPDPPAGCGGRAQR